MKNTGVLGLGAALLLTLLLGMGLLYAYRSQSPAVPPVPYAGALAAIREGRVRSVVIEDGKATLTFIDGTRQQTAIPDNGQALVQATTERNGADPAHPVRFMIENAGGPGIAPVLIGLLPILLLVALVLLGATALTRSRAPHRYEALARLADLRDRGVVTEEEFQREKRRLLK
jgi:hypothetical protein